VRLLPRLITLALLPLLTACGNGNDGKRFNPFPKKASAVNQNPVQTGGLAQAPNQFASCTGPTIYTDDAGFNSAFTGSRLCPGLAAGSTTKRSNVVRFKVNAGVPVNTRLCIVPFVYDGMAAPVCFAINGQYDAILSTDQYTSIIILPEAHLAEYEGWVGQGTGLPPSRLLFSL
jgi:hypothetical protein